MTEINLNWFGFWIMIAIISIGDYWYHIKCKELQLKYKVRFRWYDGKILKIEK